jgi:tryptophan-rich sensory protein
MKLKNIGTLCLFILGSEVVGSIGTIATIPSIPAWYRTLTKPPFTPPNWIFGPVWILLFALMGIAAYLVFEKGWKKKQVKEALFTFGIQFGLNVSWSFLFFGAHSPRAGLAALIILWVAIATSIKNFFAVNRASAVLLLPYILWVSYALYLNAGVAVLNP